MPRISLTPKPQLQIEDRGSSLLNRLSKAASSKSTAQRVLELAWTAGPVTLVASIGGYYIGHGKALPKETLVFFIAYTVITGLIGLAAHLINRLGRERRQEQAAIELTQVIGSLPDLILNLRDLRLSQLDPQQRRFEAARILLEEVELGPLWLASAIRDIGGSETLAHAVTKMDLYRRAGMPIRGEDVLNEFRAELAALTLQVANHSEPLAASLTQRFEGKGYNPRVGVQRGKYFIERIFASIDHDNDLLMTLEDVEDISTLFFELLCGRQIPMLAFYFSGRTSFARETEILEERRLKFHIVRARAYSRLLALASYLNGVTEASNRIAGLTGKELVESCQSQINEIVALIHANSDDRGRRVRILKKALNLYHHAYMAYRRTERDYNDFLKHADRWRQKLDTIGDQEVVFSVSGNKQGLQIIEDQIELSDKAKLKVVAKLSEAFQRQRFTNASYPKRIRDMKQLGIQIALALDDFIQIRKPEVQRAIYNANSINMGVFESDISSKTKISWGEALVQEVEKDMEQATLALVSAIHGYYGVELEAESCRLLADRYDVDYERLQQEASANNQARKLSGNIPSRPFPVPKPDLEWRLTLSRYS